MSCSVNSTATRSRRARSARRCHQRAAVGVRHARGRLVHQQQTRIAGQRERQLDALRVAVRQRAQWRVGEGGDARRARAARPPAARGRPKRARGTSRGLTRVREQRESRRSRARSSRRTSRRPGTCARRPASAMSRGLRPVTSIARQPARCHRPGASWPLMQLKHVVLPAPFGPISAHSSPAATANETSRPRARRRTTLTRPRTSSTGSLIALPADAGVRARRRCPCGKTSTMSRITAPSAARQ